ncbi:MAG: prepilin-type N-terminal cleavage/methylation domain-containing protein, partial [Aquabacterium sp.]|nr:prepilin-type N-terminal cleavage/methylation domain-containing protein [Aquabacterium sp.]
MAPPRSGQRPPPPQGGNPSGPAKPVPRRLLGSSNATRQGFTLVEVLVALVIMAVIAVMGWQGVDSMARSRDIG